MFIGSTTGSPNGVWIKIFGSSKKEVVDISISKITLLLFSIALNEKLEIGVKSILLFNVVDRTFSISKK